jgi:hypothetical protein
MAFLVSVSLIIRLAAVVKILLLCEPPSETYVSGQVLGLLRSTFEVLSSSVSRNRADRLRCYGRFNSASQHETSAWGR